MLASATSQPHLEAASSSGACRLGAWGLRVQLRFRRLRHRLQQSGVPRCTTDLLPMCRRPSKAQVRGGLPCCIRGCIRLPTVASCHRRHAPDTAGVTRQSAREAQASVFESSCDACSVACSRVLLRNPGTNFVDKPMQVLRQEIRRTSRPWPSSSAGSTALGNLTLLETGKGCSS